MILHGTPSSTENSHWKMYLKTLPHIWKPKISILRTLVQRFDFNADTAYFLLMRWGVLFLRTSKCILIRRENKVRKIFPASISILDVTF